MITPRRLMLLLALIPVVSACDLFEETVGEDSQPLLIDGAQVQIPFPFVGRWFKNRRVEMPLGMAGLKLPPQEILDPQLADLGNLLFFDERLSKGSVMSCATCHDPAAGYSATTFTVGVDGNRLPRTASTTLNRAFGTENLWDGARTLEEQASAPITAASEMGLTRAQLLSIVGGIPGYVDRFDRLVAVGVLSAPAVSVSNIERAIATFERLRLMSGNSRVDRFEAGEATALNAAERNGRLLFHTRARCVVCHSGPNYTDEGFHFIVPGSTGDRGRQLVTGKAADFGKFKTPSLRNAALRRPYFHNGDPLPSSGIANTLKEVVRRYNGGASPGGSPLVRRLGLSPTEQTHVASFVSALTGSIPVDPWLSQTGRPASSPERENIYLSPSIFNEIDYRDHNPDLAELSAAQLQQHWLSVGMNEGRVAVRTFSVDEYIQLHRPVFNAVNGRSDARRRAFDHYLNDGRRQGRDGRYVLARGFFRVQEYRALNGHQTALLSEEDAIQHYLTTGQSERRPSRFSPTGYFIVERTGGTSYHYADGRSVCDFASAAAQRVNRGANNDVTVPRLSFLPPNLLDGGACQTADSPPTMSVPGVDVSASVVPFQCQHKGNNAACSKTVTCPAGEKVRAVRALCNLEFGTVWRWQVRNVSWNHLTVLKRSDIVGQGHCTLDGMDIAFGEVGVLIPTAVPDRIVAGCQEHDKNGGDCHIRGEIACAP